MSKPDAYRYRTLDSANWHYSDVWPNPSSDRPSNPFYIQPMVVYDPKQEYKKTWWRLYDPSNSETYGFLPIETDAIREGQAGYITWSHEELSEAQVQKSLMATERLRKKLIIAKDAFAAIQDTFSNYKDSDIPEIAASAARDIVDEALEDWERID